MVKKIIFLLCILTVGLLFSQRVSPDLSKYPFINAEKNTLTIPSGGDSTVLNGFFAKLDSFRLTRQGKINIVHIGASHVQAGFFTNRLRFNFDIFNDTLTPSAGIIFPFKAAKTNNPRHYSVDYQGNWNVTRCVLRKNFNFPLGVTGIAIETADTSAHISIRLHADSLGRKCLFDTLTVLGQSIDRGQVEPVLKIADKDLPAAAHDSIMGTYTFVLPQPADSFSLSFRQHSTSAHSFVLNGFIPKNGSQGIVYHAVGVNGAAVPSYLNCENFERELAMLQPDLIIFGIGINDAVGKNFKPATFINNYGMLLDKIHRAAPHCAFIFVTNNDSYRRIRRNRYAVNSNGAKVETAFFEIAGQNGGAVWNQFEIMGGLSSMRKWQNAGMAMKDKIHFTRTGYELLADMFFDAMIKYGKAEQ